MTHQFYIPCIPPTATSQQKGAFSLPGKGVRFFKKANVARAEHDLLTLLHPHTPPAPFTGPLYLSIAFTWPWRKSEPKKNRASGRKWRDTKPDCSNIVKMVEDCMTRLGFWGDDSQVALLTVSKRWGDTPGISVAMQEMDGRENDNP